MLGLRVNRLQPRPSLLDLITSSSSANNTTTSTSPLPPASAANLPPLPDSPTSTSSITTPTPTPTPTSSIPSTHNNQSSVSPTPPSIPHPVYPPSHTMAPAKGNADEERGSVFSVSGSVVVAENMIGCAMYELVSWNRSNFHHDA